MSKQKALVVLSGGQDSTTCLVWALAQGYDVSAVTFDYNQRHAREIQAAKDVAKLCGVTDHEIITLGPILQGTSPLTNPAETLETYQDFKSMDTIIGDRVEKTFVPMRNALFLTVAANRAVCAGADVLVTGVCQADNANYPDCRAKFIKQQGKTLNYALGYDTIKQLDRTGPWLWIQAPLMDLSKAQSIDLLRGLAHQFKIRPATLLDPFALLAFTHTAYDGQYPPNGRDHASVLRAEGFLQAGVPDPLVVRACMEGLMDLPPTPNYVETPVIPDLIARIDFLKGELQA